MKNLKFILIFLFISTFFTFGLTAKSSVEINSNNSPSYFYLLLPPISVIEANHIDVFCNGASTGLIDLTTTGGVFPYSFQWSNGGTTEDISGLVAGIYTVTVTDFNGDTFEFTSEILQNSQLVSGKISYNVTCHGGADGSASVFITGGVAPFNYVWSNGATINSIDSLIAGLYSITITDAVGCVLNESILITEPTLLNATFSLNNPTCYNAQNGTATIVAFGGIPPYSFSWNTSPAQSTAIATGLSAGIYTCTITDSVGCERDVIVQLTEPDSLYAQINAINPTCGNGNNGEATLVANGGTPGYNYLWSNGQTTSTSTGLGAGSYSVTLTDANNCQIIQSINIQQTSPISVNIYQNNVLCFGANTGQAIALVSGGVAPYSYLWNTSPGQTTYAASGLAAGSYSVVVTDASGCSVIGNVTITQPNDLVLTPTIGNVNCNGTSTGSISILISGGNPSYTTIWSNGSTANTISGLNIGNYTVTVTDANGCSKIQSYTITQSSPIAISAALNNVLCNGSATGSITISALGGNAPYTYLWSNGTTNPSISNVVAGSYSVTITDATNCTLSATYSITEPTALNCLCNSNVTNVSCYGGSNGSITALPSGGTPTYTYEWKMIAPVISGVLATTQTISGLTAGTYQITITDANGCIKISSTVVSEPAQLLVFAAAQNAGCNGASNGNATTQVFGGVPPYSYSWSTNPVQTTSVATGLSAGSYNVVVIDSKGCSSSGSVIISQPAPLVITKVKTNVSCNGGNNGTATINVAGGNAPYSYIWSNAKTTKKITGLFAGTYTATVTDVNGCSGTTTVVITQPTKIVALFFVSNVSCNGGSNGSINLTTSGGTPGYIYLWSNGATSEDLAGLIAGKYSVTITDSKGCIIHATANITQPKPITILFSKTNVSCFGGNNGQSAAIVSGGKLSYSYLWTNGQSTGTITNLSAGIYTVFVIDANGCTNSGSVSITQPASALSCSASVLQNVSCNGGANGSAMVAASGGSAPYSYLWNTSPTKTTSVANNIPAGNYSVIVSDKKGCTSVCTVTVTQPDALVLGSIASTNVTCNGGNDGSASINNTSGGTPPYNYLWNTGASSTNSSVSGLASGIYTLTVTDFNGCTVSSNFLISQPTAIAITISQTNVNCFGGLTGSISALANGGVSSYTYTLNPGTIINNTGIFTGLGAGLYSINVSDNNGCTTSTNVALTTAAQLQIGLLSKTDILCYGSNSGTATIGGITGGALPYSLVWSTNPAQITSTATGLSSGNYDVTITDINGCTVTGSVSINQPVSPLNLNVINIVNITCNGGGLGSAEVAVSGGTATYSYLWDNGQTTSIASGLIAGNHLVTVTDANGCSKLANAYISQPGSMIISISGTNVLCNGGNDGTINTTVSGGTSPYTFNIPSIAQSNNTGSFIGLTAGNYKVYISDAGGCIDSTVFAILEPSAIILNTSKVNAICNGSATGSAVAYAAGGTAPYSYLWSNGETNNNMANLTAGVYIITVTDANGCTKIASANINEPSLINITLISSNETCFANEDGTVTATVTGGSAPYSYQWSNGNVGSAAANLNPGVYTLTVTDFNGCTSTQSTTILAATAIIVNASAGIINCYGGTTTISVNPTGGTNSYNYSWSQDLNNNTSTAIVGAGTYFVTITDGNGCQLLHAFTVTQPNELNLGYSVNNVTCTGLNNGSISVTPSGGTPVYGFVLGTDTNYTGLFSNLAAGNYSILVFDFLGCTKSLTVNISEPDFLAISMSSSNLTCGQSNGELEILISGGTGPFTYLWSNGASTAMISNLPAGTYTVTVSDNNGCGPLSTSATLLNPVPVSCSVSGTDVTCNGYQNGSASVTPLGGQGGFSYLWNTAPIQTSATATGLPAGNYSVTVIDIAGCSSSCNVVISEPTELIYLINQTDINCANSNSGVATIYVFGGTSPYTYLWGNGQTTETATGLSVGSNYVTVTDLNGCTIQACAVLTQNAAMTCNTTSTDASCGQANGSATVSVVGGQAPFSYLWSDGSNVSTATGLLAGNYTVVVTDANGCSSACYVTISQPDIISFSLLNIDATCAGGMGSISIYSLSGGVSPYTYLWSNGDTNSSVSSVLAGVYTVTVSDAGGCSASNSATISEPAGIVITSSQINVSCNGGSNGSAGVTVSGGVGPYIYEWNNGDDVDIISGLNAGAYIVTVTDDNGCSSTTQIIITEPSVLDTISTSSTNANCGLSVGTATVNMTGGTAPYTYQWLIVPAQTTQTATGLSAGLKIVVVTDANGCTNTIAINVQGSTGLSLNLSSFVFADGNNISCNGGNNGSINLTVGGSGPFLYLWNNGSTNEDQSGLAAGTYTVGVTNGFCSKSSSITLTEGAVWNISTTQVNVLCNGINSGSATVTATGGVNPLSYNWSNGQFTQTAVNLSAGTYTATVTDANGCSHTTSVLISQPAAVVSISAINTNPLCNGNNNGSIDITASGGVAPYSYHWSDGVTLEDRSGMGTGSWIVTVTDANGCSNQITVVLNQPAKLVISTSSTYPNCIYGNAGSISINVYGGTPAYSYLWSNGSTGTSISNLTVGTYTVTVTDANACSISASVAISQVPVLVLSTSSTNVSAYGGNNGTAGVSVSGGTGPYTYSWNTLPVKTTANITGLTAGVYAVVVVDHFGCSSSANVVITQPAYLCDPSSTFRTETPSSWVVAPNGNPTQAGQYLANNFATAFPSGLVAGGSCIGGKTLTLTSVSAVQNFLVNQATTGPGTLLTSNLINPTSISFPSVLAANCVALTLNTVFDATDAAFAPIPTVRLQDLVYGLAPFSGYTVGQILAEGNKKLAGCTSSFTAAQISFAIAKIDSSYKGGLATGLSSILSCPGIPPRVLNESVYGNELAIKAFPNPTTGVINVSFYSVENSKVVVKIFDLAGRNVWSIQENSFTGNNLRTYDISQFAKGMYLLNVNIDGKSESLRISIQ